MQTKKIKSALISVFYKDGLAPIVQALHDEGVQLISTGGTEQYIKDLGLPCTPVEQITGFPSILGGRVKTLHPLAFGGILGRRHLEQDLAEMEQHQIPEIDLVVVDLYPFEETLKQTDEEAKIIEKIDIGGPSMIRAAAKNYKDVAVVAAKGDYTYLLELIQSQNASTTLEQRRVLAAKAFHIVMDYDIVINNYFNDSILQPLAHETALRYGENPHQSAHYYGDLSECLEQLNGKAVSYNNLVDIDAAVQLIADFDTKESVFAVFKHTNVCGLAQRKTTLEAWQAALAGDAESAFGGVLICNQEIDTSTAEAIDELFFEILIAPSFSEAALTVLKKKKNRILLQLKTIPSNKFRFQSILNGTLAQEADRAGALEWNVACGEVSAALKEDLIFANIAVKHLKSNAIALAKNKQLLGKGCGQTSRVDALRQSIEKAKQFGQDLSGAVMASDAFFPFADCVEMAHKVGVTSVIQPGGSIRDKDSIAYCEANGMTMVLTKTRHFKH